MNTMPPQYNGNVNMMPPLYSANVNTVHPQQAPPTYVLPTGHYPNANQAPVSFPTQVVATPAKKKEVNWVAVVSVVLCLLVGLPLAIYFFYRYYYFFGAMRSL